MQETDSIPCAIESAKHVGEHLSELIKDSALIAYPPVTTGDSEDAEAPASAPAACSSALSASAWRHPSRRAVPR